MARRRKPLARRNPDSLPPQAAMIRDLRDVFTMHRMPGGEPMIFPDGDTVVMTGGGVPMLEEHPMVAMGIKVVAGMHGYVATRPQPSEVRFVYNPRAASRQSTFSVEVAPEGVHDYLKRIFGKDE